MSKNYFKSARWDAGISNAIDAATAGAFDSPEEITAAESDPLINAGLRVALEPVANLALRLYDRRIRAYFRLNGIDIGDDFLTVESIKAKIESATGLEILELTTEGILDALEKPLAKALSELFGFVITKVFDQIELKRQVKEHVLERLKDGEGGGVIAGEVLHQLRDVATWVHAGLGPVERRRVMNRAYQKKYRKTHAQTWQ